MSNPASLVLGKPAQAAATVTDASGNPVTNATVTWAEDSSGAVLTIDSASGAITLVAVGSATITATATDTAGDTGRGTCACTVSQAAPGVLTVTVDVTQ